MKKNTTALLVLLLAVLCRNAESLNEYGFDSLSHEIESELVLENPSTVKPEMLSRVIGLIFNKVTTLSRYATILDADETLREGDHFSKCVQERRDEVKDVVKPGVIAFIKDCYNSLHSDFTSTLKSLFDVLSKVTISEEMESTEQCMIPLQRLPPSEIEKGMNGVLKCLGEIKYTDPEVLEFVTEFVKTRKATQEGSTQRGNQCFNKLVTKLRRKAGTLNDQITKCAEVLRELHEDQETSHNHTKESVNAYHAKIQAEVEEYVEGMRKSLFLEKCDVTTVPATEIVTKGTADVKVMEATMVIEDNGDPEFFEKWVAFRKDLLESGEAGLNHCLNGVKRIQKYLDETKLAIEESLLKIKTSMTEELEDCLSEGLVKSTACLYQFEINMREDYDEEMRPMVEQSRLWLNEGDFEFIEKSVQECVDSVTNGVAKEVKEMLEKISQGETPAEKSTEKDEL